MDNMIEVDPKLFVTCRLCLEDMGHFQIVPIVQQQIKYCFDIDVEPFDGLPQLICLKCKNILSNFYSLKQKFCEKQGNLRSKVTNKEINDICLQPQQDTVSSSQPASDINDSIQVEKPKSKKSRVIESSESEPESEKCNVVKTRNKNNVLSKQHAKWDSSGYKKSCICLICKTEWQNPKAYLIHRRVHLNLRKAHPIVFKNNCSVVLNRVDSKPNLTGEWNMVVHNQNKITQFCNTSYYLRYTRPVNDRNHSESGVSDKSSKRNVNHESSDTEQESIVKRPKRRQRQALSRSSNETVVIESHTKKNESDCEEDTNPLIKDCTKPLKEKIDDDQCINIDDSSDSDTERNQTETTQKAKQPLEAGLGDFKIIQGIISMCVSAYHRKNETAEKSDKQTTSESHLKHKVLSIGRKIINRQGFNWTGLLRYMEHKNLDIEWVTKAIPISKESNYIRIMTKLRGTETLDDVGWEPVASTDPPPVPKSITPDTSLNVCRSMPPVTPAINNVQPQNMDTAILFICSPPDPQNKLLNANPVPNPKQLPRKVGLTNDSRINKIAADTTASFKNNEENDFSMPIITSTTSLAVPAEKDDASSATAANAEAPAPRIKVKPVSELMSERILNSLRNEQRSEASSNMLLKQSEKNIDAMADQPQNTNVVLNQNFSYTPSASNMYMSNVIAPQMTVTSQPVHLVQLPCLSVATSQNLRSIAPMPTPSTSNRQYNVSVRQADDSYGVRWHTPANLKDAIYRVNS